METKTVHFSIGENFGATIMSIAQEHLTEGNDPVKALKTLTEGLMGCPTDLAVSILKGDIVLFVDKKEQTIIPTQRATEGVLKAAHDKIFPKVDPLWWIKRQKDNISGHGEDLIKGFKALRREIRRSNNKFTIDISYDDLFKFIAGNDQIILDDLRDNYEVDAIGSLFKATKQFIETSMKIINTMDWMLMSFDEFADGNTYAIYRGHKEECSQTLTDVMFVMKETLNFEFSMDCIKEFDDVQKYINTAREIDEIIIKGIEPVDILDNYSAGWLTPTGEYYALNGEIANMLHIQIANALQEIGVIPEEELNPDSWLDQHGWVKIHGTNINYGGCNNHRIGKRDTNLTDIQIKKIYEYCTFCHNGIIKLGWKMEQVSAIRFKDMAEENIEEINSKYFDI